MDDIGQCRRILWNTKHQRYGIANPSRRADHLVVIDNLIVLFRLLMFYEDLLQDDPDFWPMVAEDWGLANAHDTVRIVHFYDIARVDYLQRPSEDLPLSPYNTHNALLCDLVDRWADRGAYDAARAPRLNRVQKLFLRQCWHSALNTRRAELFKWDLIKLPRDRYWAAHDPRVASEVVAMLQNPLPSVAVSNNMARPQSVEQSIYETATTPTHATAWAATMASGTSGQSRISTCPVSNIKHESHTNEAGQTSVRLAPAGTPQDVQEIKQPDAVIAEQPHVASGSFNKANSSRQSGRSRTGSKNKSNAKQEATASSFQRALQRLGMPTPDFEAGGDVEPQAEIATESEVAGRPVNQQSPKQLAAKPMKGTKTATSKQRKALKSAQIQPRLHLSLETLQDQSDEQPEPEQRRRNRKRKRGKKQDEATKDGQDQNEANHKETEAEEPTATNVDEPVVSKALRKKKNPRKQANASEEREPQEEETRGPTLITTGPRTDERFQQLEEKYKELEGKCRRFQDLHERDLEWKSRLIPFLFDAYERSSEDTGRINAMHEDNAGPSIIDGCERPTIQAEAAEEAPCTVDENDSEQRSKDASEPAEPPAKKRKKNKAKKETKGNKKSHEGEASGDTEVPKEAGEEHWEAPKEKQAKSQQSSKKGVKSERRKQATHVEMVAKEATQERQRNAEEKRQRKAKKREERRAEEERQRKANERRERRAKVERQVKAKERRERRAAKRITWMD